MSKILVRCFSVITLLSIFFSQLAPIPVAAASPGANGKIVVVKNSDLWLVDVSGSQWAQLTNTAADAEWNPSWSSDGSQLAYACLNQTAICLSDKDGSNYNELVNGTDLESVDWNPDDYQVLYLKNKDLWRIDTNGTNDTQITFTGGNIQSGHYSPDGSKIVYVDNNGISVMNADGSSPVALPTVPGDKAPDWSPDGSKIVFSRGFSGDSSRDIWVMQADGLGQVNITNDGADFDYEAAWSPDGSKILITRDSGLWMVEPDGNNPTLITPDAVRVPAWQPVNVFAVNSTGDLPDIIHGDGICETTIPDECTFRAAIEETNAITAVGSLTIQLDNDVTLTTDLPSFTNTTVDAVIVNANGHQVDGASAYSLIDINAGVEVYLNDITLNHGLNTSGGAIHNDGDLDLMSSTLVNNSADDGGGIYNTGTMLITNSLFAKNTAGTGYGGAINTSNNATIVNSTFTENHAFLGGAGVANRLNGDTDLYNVTMLGNQAEAPEGAAYAGLDTSSNGLWNSLFAGNTATGSGGGPEASVSGSATIVHTHNLFGTASMTTAQALAGFSPDPTDILATSDGTNPTALTGILNPVLSFNATSNAAFHRLVFGSPAIDAGDNTICSGSPVYNIDQRSVSRPVGSACDIGAYEADTNLFLVTNVNDAGPGSLRDTLTTANSVTNTPVAADQIQFAISGLQPYTISPTSALPAISETVQIDGGNKVILDGVSAGAGANGLSLNSSNNRIQNITVKNFDGAGVVVTSGAGNVITKNSIYNNQALDIDLGNDGVTFNHDNSIIIGPNNYQNYPVLDLATSANGMLRLVGSLESEFNQQFIIDVYKNQDCHATFFGGGENYIGSFTVGIADSIPSVKFDQTLNVGLTEPQGVTLTATSIRGTSEFSYCRPVSTENLNWAQAQLILSGPAIQQYITDNFQEKWFKFPVQPGAKVSVKLTSQPGSAVSLHTDPRLIYDTLVEPEDETAVSAESADVAFLPAGSLPSRSLSSGSLPSGSLPSGSLPAGYLPSRSLPSRSLPSGSLPSGSLPFGTLPSRSLPAGSLPSGSLPSGSLPAGAIPSRSLPSRSLPSRSLPPGLLPSRSLPDDSVDAYATAARRSLVAISMNPNTTVYTIQQNTYDYLGDLYVRVVSPYDLNNPFTLQILVEGGVCNTIAPVPNSLHVISGPPPGVGTHKSLLLTDSGRLTGTAPEITTTLADLQTLAERSEVDGLVIDLSDAKYERVNWANTQADQNLACPSARNIVATEIKNVINAYRKTNSTLEYIVLAGGADVIPYFQTQDIAEMSNEKDYVVPVAPQTASEAGLALNMVQGQDGYGSVQDFTQAGYEIPFPDLAVGRLVDSAGDITSAINAYIATGGVINPASSLVTGYDFVGDGAQAIKTELDAGTGTSADTLIQPPGEAPDGPNAWTATDLSNKLFTNHYGILALSGHFSAGDLLAADYTTQLSASSLASPSIDLTDSLVLTLGCHGGYTIPNDDLLLDASPNPDWAKAILRKGAAGYIAATGYAYGDTELVEYGERLFVLLSQQLRTGTGPISIGQALMEAKRQYLAGTTQLTGIDQKTITETTLYGLPMMKVDMPGVRLADVTSLSSGSIVTSTTPVTTGPGANFELSNSDVISLNPALTLHTLQLENLSNNTPITTTYYSGADGVISNPYEPIYPQEIDDVQYDGSVLRGVAFRGGTYTDQTGIIPLTTAPATETTSAHESFNSTVFYPNQVWMPNYSDAVNDGDTKLMVFPAQYRSSGPGAIDGTLRLFDQLDLQFFYLPDSWTNPETHAAAVSAAPSVLGASAEENSGNVNFTANVTADGSGGVQAVWILYTGKAGSPFYGSWLPLDLTQDADDTDTWTGSLPLPGGADVNDIQFMVQAVGGAGLTTLDTQNGAFYSVAPENITPPPPPAATTLTLVSPPASGTYSQDSTFNLHLAAGALPVADALVTLDIGGQQSLATTDGNGDASITLTIQLNPGIYTVEAGFDGDSDYLSSLTTSAFTVSKDTVSITSTSDFVATLKNSSNYPLVGKSVIFVIHDGANSFIRSVNSNFLGRARLGSLQLPAGIYTVDIYFSGTIPVGPGNSLTLNDLYFQSAHLLNAGTLTSTSPTVDITAKKADNTPYTAGTWTNQTVTVHFACTDSDGVASCPTDQVFSADGTYTASGTATDKIGNTANVSFGPIKIDKIAPTLTPTISPQPVYLAKAATASAGATDVSGIASQSCGAVLTSTIGFKTVTCTATDGAGNTANASLTYWVIYHFTGFLKPVYNLPALNKMKAGQAIQVNFNLGGNQGKAIFAPGYPRSIKIACGSAPVRIVKTITAGVSSLKYNPISKLYTYTWKTDVAWAGTCRQFVVKFKDGRVYRLNFKFTP